jgi:hypothetical protein
MAVRKIFYQKPLVERGKPIVLEMLWVLLGRQKPGQHKKLLPDYCYNILDVFRKTYFKGFPLLSETVLVTDQAGLAAAKTVEAAKRVIRFDWRNLGKLAGIGTRCVRFAELEAEEELDKEGFEKLAPDKVLRLFTMVCGEKWVAQNQSKLEMEAAETILTELLNQHTASWIAKIPRMLPTWTSVAYQWSPEAMAKLHEGYAEGINCFLDENSQLAGESSRSGLYGFLLLVWPEIRAMLGSSPRKTLTDLHEWMQPFMRVGFIAQIDIETLRDVCAPQSQFGIGLRLTKLSARSARQSA